MENKNPFETPVAKKEFNGFWIPSHNAKVFKEGLENNKAPFLPDQNGKIKAEPIYNAATGYSLPANRLIPVQFAKLNKGYESNVVAYRTSINGMDNYIREGEKGVFYNFKDEKDGTIHTSSLFFAEQTENPEVFMRISSEKIKQMDNLKDYSMVIGSSEPKEYLGSYLAACKAGFNISVDPALASEFKANILPTLENDMKKIEEKNKELPSLGNILFEADKRSSEILKSLVQSKEVTQEQEKPKPKQTRKQNDNEYCF